MGAIILKLFGVSLSGPSSLELSKRESIILPESYNPAGVYGPAGIYKPAIRKCA